MQESARRIGKVSEEAKLEIDVDTYVDSFKPHIMDVVFAWANGASFSQICKMTDAFEGIDINKAVEVCIELTLGDTKCSNF